MKQQNNKFYRIIALLPATIFGIYTFGASALLVILITTSTAVLTEYAYQKLTKKKVTIEDLSALFTGLLLALSLPSTAPWWMCVLGSIFSILIVKQICGNLKWNCVNPALAANCLLMICFAGRMTNYVYAGDSGVTPLMALETGEYIELLDVVIGNVPGAIGATSVIAIGMGVIFLAAMKIIDLYIPCTYIVSFLVFVGLFGERGFRISHILIQLCGGGIVLGAWFMAVNYGKSPITTYGKIIYGIILGIFTGVFRLFIWAEGAVPCAIFIGSFLIPLIDKIDIPALIAKLKESEITNKIKDKITSSIKKIIN